MQILLCFVPQTLCCMTLISCWCSPAWPPSCLSPWCACACAPPPAPAWARVSDHAAGARHGDDHPTWSNILSETDKYFPLGFLLLNFAQWLFCQNFKWVFIENIYKQSSLFLNLDPPVTLVAGFHSLIPSSNIILHMSSEYWYIDEW